MLLAQMPDPNPVVVALSLAYIAYYTTLSVYLTLARSVSGTPATSHQVSQAAGIGGPGD